MTSPRKEGEQGFVLILVMWIVGLLGVLAAGIAANSRGQAEIVHNRLELAQARAIADAGVMLAIDRLLDPDPAAQWRPDGAARTIRYDNSDLAITIQDEAGKIDINVAPRELISGILEELGFDRSRLEGIVGAILARREAFTAPGVSGASLSGRQSFGFDRSLLPFATTSELRRLEGMTRVMYDRIRPYMTVYSQAPTINPLTAPREVLLALPGIGPQQVDFLLAARAAAARGQPYELPYLAGAEQYLGSRGLGAMTITAKAVTQAGATFDRSAVVLVAPQIPTQPFAILQWTQAIDVPETGPL